MVERTPEPDATLSESYRNLCIELNNLKMDPPSMRSFKIRFDKATDIFKIYKEEYFKANSVGRFFPPFIMEELLNFIERQIESDLKEASVKETLEFIKWRRDSCVAPNIRGFVANDLKTEVFDKFEDRADQILDIIENAPPKPKPTLGVY